MSTHVKLTYLSSFFTIYCVCLFVVWLIKPSYLANILISYLPVTLINLYFLPNNKGRIILFAVFTALFFAIPVELSARLANAWDVQSIFPRLLGVIPLENVLYAFFNFVWPIALYKLIAGEDREATQLNPRFKYLIFLYLALSGVTYALYIIDKNLITLHYWQVAIIILVIPTVLIMTQSSQVLKMTLIVTLFFALVFFSHEIVSMSLGHWWWPGEYLLETKVFGHRFPLDDVIIWYLLSTPALIGGYKYFVDEMI